MVILGIAESKNIELQHHINGADIAEIMPSLIHEETNRLHPIQPHEDDISASGEDNENPTEQPPTSSVLSPPEDHLPPPNHCQQNLKNSQQPHPSCNL